MTFAEYRQEVIRTADARMGPEIQKAIMALGIAGEAGEVADLIKKHIGHGHPLDLDKLKKELGDVLWYVVAVGLSAGVDIDDIAAANIAKLRIRYPDGFDRARSLNREGES